MKKIGGFDCMCLRQKDDPAAVDIRLASVFPQAWHCDAADQSAQEAALAAMHGAYVLLLPAHVLPFHALAAQVPDPLLLSAGYRIGWLAKNVVTAELASTPGPVLWPRAALLNSLQGKDKAARPALAVMPECQADWAFNTSSGAAFNAGFEHISALGQADTPQANQRRMVAASFGCEARFADWWHLGVFAALPGADNRNSAYKKEQRLLAEIGDMTSRLQDLTRWAQCEFGLNVQRLSPQKSAFFKKNRFKKAPRDVFDSLAALYEGLGNAGRQKAEKYRAAATWIWGG